MGSIKDDNRITPEDVETTDSTDKERTVEAGGLDDIESRKKAFAEEETRAEKYLANWQRAQADFVNFKRRTEQERGDIVKLANAGLILNLLSVADDMERALEHVSGKAAGSKWVDGIVLIYRKFMSILEANGVSQMKALGEQFDPNMHEAAAHVEGEDGRIIDVVQKGYMLNDRVLRPARVSVGNGRNSASGGDVSKDE